MILPRNHSPVRHGRAVARSDHVGGPADERDAVDGEGIVPEAFMESRQPGMRRRASASACARKSPDALTFAIRIARSAALFTSRRPGRARSAHGVLLFREAFARAVRVRFRGRSAPALRARRDFGRFLAPCAGIVQRFSRTARNSSSDRAVPRRR